MKYKSRQLDVVIGWVVLFVTLSRLSCFCSAGTNWIREARSPLAFPALRRGNFSSRLTEVSLKPWETLPWRGSMPSFSSAGFYFGLSSDVLKRPEKQSRPLSLAEAMSQTLEEMRSMRHEMEELRRELHAMKRKMIPDEDDTEESGDGGVGNLLAKRKRQKEFDRIGMEVERWAEKLLFEEDGEVNGWKEITCAKMVRKAFNPDERTRVYIKWMKDSRGENARVGDDTLYPCIKVLSSFDAPLEQTCAYLAQEKNLHDYNDLLDKHRELEEVSSHSKVCWGQSPQILFIKPRDFVTFCHHRWRRDGTQVIVNQAVDHPKAPGNDKEKEGKACRAYALRGANFISRDPDDPNRTRFALLAHASAGPGIATWACKTAANALAPIEPFKLCHKINEGIKRMPPFEEPIEHAEMVSMPGRSAAPGGMAQLGYACFWPNGGGLKEGLIHAQHSTRGQDDAAEEDLDPVATVEVEE